MPKPDDLVVIETFANGFDANIALTKLRDRDVPCMLSSELWNSVMAVPSASFDAIRLYVFARDADRAREILADVE